MRTIAPEHAGLAIVLLISLIAPWDTAGIRLGFILAIATMCATAFVTGRRPAVASAIFRGAVVGFLAALLYVVGTFVVFDSGWYGRDWGESDLGPSAIFWFSALVGPPAAVIGALSAAIGNVLYNHPWRHAHR